MIRIKRAYEAPEPSDGERYLVDRLWPRGVNKEALDIAAWPKEAGPSDELRKWFGHVPERYPEFRRRYRRELKGNQAVQSLLEAARRGDITLVYSARDEEHNQAVVLKEWLEESLAGKRSEQKVNPEHVRFSGARKNLPAAGGRKASSQTLFVTFPPSG